MELNKRYAESDTAIEIYTELASGDNRTKQDRIYETLQHGKGEHAEKTTPSAKRCTRCSLVNSILIGLLIIVVSVSLYVCINVSKAPNSKADLQKLVTTLSKKIDMLEHAQGQIQIGTLQNLTNKLNETTDLQKLVATLSQNNDKLEHAQGQIQTKVLQITNRLNETADLQKMVATLSQKNDKLELALGEIQTKVLQNTNRLNETNKSLIPIVGFSAHLSSTVTTTERVVFDTVITNQGEGYDNSTGIFTAPYTGLYFFSAHVCSQRGLHVQYTIFKEDKELTFSLHKDDRVDSCSSASTIDMVNKTERVWVEGRSANTVFYNSFGWNAFSGSLLNI